MGLPQSIIQSLKDGGNALLLVCTGCRVKTPHGPGGGGGDRHSSDNGGNSPALRQLHETVKALCISVKTLSDQVSTLTNQVCCACAQHSGE